MKKTLNVIPTPYKYTYTEGACFEISELTLPPVCGKMLLNAKRLFDSKVTAKLGGKRV